MDDLLTVRMGDGLFTFHQDGVAAGFADFRRQLIKHGGQGFGVVPTISGRFDSQRHRHGLSSFPQVLCVRQLLHAGSRLMLLTVSRDDDHEVLIRH